ncbi:TonB-dependent receptor plug domain-containing protein [Sinomicrobium weinanense]|uniref:TonB-dependent receptor n=1 Tax=Sinomicrobium weinanense TaxID=2842200 RepID=A0A926Q2E2_9FLAO|nr:TonB-dependent receptor [Sinomicrobium weinanense]MBC9794816.1 TonB-dependent receptor [Sinomicrobium weinanense]MBU3125075.1 TonB-dependent receptor [Sinomicrobium weinanense]
MKKRTISFGALALLCTAGFAQEVQQLDEVVVTDSRFELKREHSGKTVIKISAEELEKNQGKNLAEVINTKSGIEIGGSRSNAGQNLGYYVRGGGNRQVLVLIDGVQVTDPSSIYNDFDLRLVDLAQIESVEIVKGAASTLYGNAAATAVISITTKKASEKPVSATFRSSIGTNQAHDDQDYDIADFSNSIAVSGTSGKVNYQAGFAQQYTDGLSAAASGTERDPFSRFNTNVKVGYQATERFSVDVFGNYDKFKVDFDGSDPADYTRLIDTPDQSMSKQYRVGVVPKFDYGNGSVQASVAYNKIERETRSAGSTVYNANSLVVDVFNKYNFNDRFYTIVGVNYMNNEAEFDRDRDFSVVDPYANVVWVSGFGLNMNAGARLNNHSEYGTHFTYNLNPSYTFSLENDRYIKALGSFSTSYIAPSLSQLYGYFGPNPDLDPEEDRTLEGGLEFGSGAWRLSALYFNRKEKDYIFYGPEGYVNVNEDFNVNGVEAEISIKPLDFMQLDANYTFTEKKDELLLRIPKHKINATAGFTLCPTTFASVSYQYMDDRLDAGNVEMDSFSIFDVYLSHSILKDKMKLFANVSNIFNEDYVELVGYTTRGRNVRVGFSLMF